MLHTNDDEIVVRAGMIVRLSQSSSFSASAALEEGAEPHSYTLAMVIEVLRRSKELIVCALPDEEGKEYEDAEAMKRGATPVLGVVKAVKRDADRESQRPRGQWHAVPRDGGHPQWRSGLVAQVLVEGARRR